MLTSCSDAYMLRSDNLVLTTDSVTDKTTLVHAHRIMKNWERGHEDDIIFSLPPRPSSVVFTMKINIDKRSENEAVSFSLTHDTA